MVRRKPTWHEARPDENIDGSLSDKMKVMDDLCHNEEIPNMKTAQHQRKELFMSSWVFLSFLLKVPD